MGVVSVRLSESTTVWAEVRLYAGRSTSVGNGVSAWSGGAHCTSMPVVASGVVTSTRMVASPAVSCWSHSGSHSRPLIHSLAEPPLVNR